VIYTKKRITFLNIVCKIFSYATLKVVSEKWYMPYGTKFNQQMATGGEQRDAKIAMC